MSRPSKRQLREAKGRSIYDQTPADTPLESLIPTRRIRTPVLGQGIISQMKLLYPYMRDAPSGFRTFERIVYDLKCDLYPEGSIFFWKEHVLSTLHALNLTTYFGPPFPRPKLPTLSSLRDRATMETYLSFPKEHRMKIHAIVYRAAFGKRDSIDSHDVFCVAQAFMEVRDANSEEHTRIEKGQERSLAKEYGARCSACNSVGKEKMACSRCQEVFYCGRQCQKAHWKEHKQECVKKEQTKSKA